MHSAAGCRSDCLRSVQVVHVNVGFDFLGFRIQWRPKRGTAKWYIATRTVQTLKDKIRALTRRTSQQPPRTALIRINQHKPWMGQLRPARGLQAHLRSPEHHMAPGHQLVAQGTPLERRTIAEA